VTNHVAFFEVDKDGERRRPISYSNPGNITRGIFFGTLAYAVYGGKKVIQPKKEVVHIVKSGESLGGIAARHTGSVLNYKAIADYNGITNPNALKVGQRIRIPINLQRHK